MSDKVRLAKEIATKSHEGQVRKFTSEPYIVHPERTVRILNRYNRNPDLTCSMWLHDVIEDCGVRPETIHQLFGPVVTGIVVELTNVYTKKNYPRMKRAERKLRECERIANISWSAKLLKLCDRYDNVLDFERNDPSWDQDHFYIKETLQLLEALNGVEDRIVTEIKQVLFSSRASGYHRA